MQASIRAPLSPHIYGLDKTVDLLAARILARERFGLTHQELLDLLVPSEFHEALITAGRITELSLGKAYAIKFGDKDNYLTFTAVAIDGTPPPLAASIRYIKDPRGNVELYERLTTWLARRIEVGTEFGRVKWLLRRLDDTCRSVAQVKYYWPAISTLASAGSTDNGTAAMVEILNNAGNGRNAPPLPLDVRAACQPAAATVTLASMLDDTPIKDDRPVRVELYTAYGESVLDPLTKQLVPLL